MKRFRGVARPDSDDNATNRRILCELTSMEDKTARCVIPRNQAGRTLQEPPPREFPVACFSYDEAMPGSMESRVLDRIRRNPGCESVSDHDVDLERSGRERGSLPADRSGDLPNQSP